MFRIIFAQIVIWLLVGLSFGWCIDDERLEKLQIYFETEMYEEASSLLDELIVQFPDDPRFKYLLAIIDYQREDYDRAGKVFVEFIKEHPGVAEPYYLLGEITLKRGNKNMARKYLSRYCELVPQDIDARHKLDLISNNIGSADIIIIKNGKKDSALVKKIGFYGACVHSQQEHSIKLINGSFRKWSSMGIDFAYPVDLRGKKIVLELKGKQGGERLDLIFRDKFAPDYNPQLELAAEEKSVSPDWQQIKVTLGKHQPEIDLSSVVHMGLELGSSTVQNPVQSTLFIKNIVIENASN